MAERLHALWLTLGMMPGRGRIHFATNTAFVDTTLTHTFATNLIVGVNKALVRFRDGA